MKRGGHIKEDPLTLGESSQERPWMLQRALEIILERTAQLWEPGRPAPSVRETSWALQSMEGLLGPVQASPLQKAGGTGSGLQ